MSQHDFVDIAGLDVVFRDGTVGLADISVQFARGEFIALIGPSGSGKTTLLRSIAGFVHPSAGSISVDGVNLVGTPPEQRKMGMVFQQHAVWPHMSVGANVGYPLRRAQVPRADITKQVAQTLELVGLPGFARRMPASLSGGQRQRVALARAIIAQPRLLLLDEALSALDEPLRDSLRRELVALSASQELTTVHVTHDRAEALAIADRVVVLIDGVVAQVTEPASLLQTPASPQVARFISDATVVSAQLSSKDGQQLIVAPDLGLHWRLDEVTIIDGGSDELTVAVLPHQVSLAPVGTEDTVAATISSVLYDRGSYSLSCTTAQAGMQFRATVAGQRPQIGQQVGLRIRQPLVYTPAGTSVLTA